METITVDEMTGGPLQYQWRYLVLCYQLFKSTTIEDFGTQHHRTPLAVDGKVVIRPMMYLAFSYDHRIIDGRESVGF